jgi:hypothetical protein
VLASQDSQASAFGSGECAVQVCRREGIPVVLRPPNLAELASWEGSFISSTSRLVRACVQTDRQARQGTDRQAGWGAIASSASRLVPVGRDKRSRCCLWLAAWRGSTMSCM